MSVSAVFSRPESKLNNFTQSRCGKCNCDLKNESIELEPFGYVCSSCKEISDSLNRVFEKRERLMKSENRNFGVVFNDN